MSLWLGYNSQPTKQTSSLCSSVQGQNYPLEKMHKSGSQIQLWLRPSGWGLPRVMGTGQQLLGRLTREGFPTATMEPLPTTRSAPGSSPALTFVCVTWMVSPTISDSNSTISDSKPHLPSNVIYCRVDVMCPHFCPCYVVLTITFMPHISRLYVSVPQKMGTDGFKTNTEPSAHSLVFWSCRSEGLEGSRMRGG